MKDYAQASHHTSRDNNQASSKNEYVAIIEAIGKLMEPKPALTVEIIREVRVAITEWLKILFRRPHRARN